MCGKEATLVRAKIEMAEMDVCEKCAKHGVVLRRLDVPSAKKKERREIKPQKEIIEEVVEDYAQIVRKSREDKGMSQEDFAKKLNEKESVIHKIETGGLIPSLKLARKLERLLHIRLIEIVEEHHNAAPSSSKKGSELTLGDLIKIKKK